MSRLVVPLQRLFKFWGSRFSFVATILTPPNVDVCTCRSLSTRIVFELHRYRFINPFTCLSPQHALFTLLDPITVTLRRNADLHLFYGQKVKDSSDKLVWIKQNEVSALRDVGKLRVYAVGDHILHTFITKQDKSGTMCVEILDHGATLDEIRWVQSEFIFV